MASPRHPQVSHTQSRSLVSGVHLGRPVFLREDSAHGGQLADGLAPLRQHVDELEMQTGISTAGGPSITLPSLWRGSHSRMGMRQGDKYRMEIVKSGLWTCGQERLQRPGYQRDTMPLRRMKSSGAQATWLCEGCSLPPRGRSRRWKAGGPWGLSLGCQLCSGQTGPSRSWNSQPWRCLGCSGM